MKHYVPAICVSVCALIFLIFVASVSPAPLPELPAVDAIEVHWNKYLAARLDATTPRLYDGSLPDLCFGVYACEVDWADRKWREAIGQAHLYAALTDREPAMILLVRDHQAERHELMRAALAAAHARVTMFIFDCKRGEFLKGPD